MKGSSTVEFVLVLPWFVLFLVGMVTAVIWFFTGTLLHYAAFKGARTASVYNFAGAQKAVQEIFPQANVSAPNQTYRVEFLLQNWRPALSLAASAPIVLSLGGVQTDLNSQGEKDRFGYSFMDNWVGFCGEKGRYGLCQD